MLEIGENLLIGDTWILFELPSYETGDDGCGEWGSIFGRIPTSKGGSIHVHSWSSDIYQSTIIGKWCTRPILCTRPNRDSIRTNSRDCIGELLPSISCGNDRDGSIIPQIRDGLTDWACSWISYETTETHIHHRDMLFSSIGERLQDIVCCPETIRIEHLEGDEIGTWIHSKYTRPIDRRSEHSGHLRSMTIVINSSIRSTDEVIGKSSIIILCDISMSRIDTRIEDTNFYSCCWRYIWDTLSCSELVNPPELTDRLAREVLRTRKSLNEFWLYYRVSVNLTRNYSTFHLMEFFRESRFPSRELYTVEIFSDFFYLGSYTISRRKSCCNFLETSSWFDDEPVGIRSLHRLSSPFESHSCIFLIQLNIVMFRLSFMLLLILIPSLRILRRRIPFRFKRSRKQGIHHKNYQ